MNGESDDTEKKIERLIEKIYVKTKNSRTNYSSGDKIILREDEINGDISKKFRILNKLLGKGSFGDVYLAIDEHGKNVAIKCCKMDEEIGIPNILETTIMTSIIHPHINGAKKIYASSKKLYIIQELATTDLAHHTRGETKIKSKDIKKLQHWCFSLAQAVSALHSKNIIHGDIKASNVLLFENGTIKLTDFTLAIKKIYPSQKFTHTVCTCTHRPIECLLKQSWDESLDIWSLGCTFYEIAYGCLLFPYQASRDLKDKTINNKHNLVKKSVNAIIDWGKNGPYKNSNNNFNNFTDCPDFINFHLNENFNNHNMSTFNDLICKMLIIDANKRPTINEILLHPFFFNLKQSKYISINIPSCNISVNEEARVLRYIEQHTTNDFVKQHSFYLYSRCLQLSNINENLKAIACVWISQKIIIGLPTHTPSSSIPLENILTTERVICHFLQFRLI